MKDFKEVELRSKMHLVLLLLSGFSVILIFKSNLDKETLRLLISGLAVYLMYSVYRLNRYISYLYNNLIIDELTKVYNYRYFIARLAEEMDRAERYARPLVLAFSDCDSFKSYNDKYGHLEGNAALERIGRILKQNIRASDIVARFGGDEFAVILPETNIMAARVVMERAANVIEKTVYKTEPGEVTISVSLINYTGEDITEFLERADAILYRAKQNKKRKAAKTSNLSEV